LIVGAVSASTMEFPIALPRQIGGVPQVMNPF
jgi:hypothetical protein